MLSKLSGKSPARRVALATCVALSCLASVSASAALAGPLDGETLTGFTQSHGCRDAGNGTTNTSRTIMSGTAAGPIVGTFDGGLAGSWDSTTGSVTDFSVGLDIYPASDPGTDIYVDVELGGGHGVGSCSAGAWTLNVTDATYTTQSGDTGVVSVSASQTPPALGTFTANFGPQLPTSKTQCEKNGWKTFPGFKNQGDCVSYVATKGKNKPAGS